jgi:predicted amidohydrolase
MHILTSNTYVHTIQMVPGYWITGLFVGSTMGFPYHHHHCYYTTTVTTTVPARLHQSSSTATLIDREREKPE